MPSNFTPRPPSDRQPSTVEPPMGGSRASTSTVSQNSPPAPPRRYQSNRQMQRASNANVADPTGGASRQAPAARQAQIEMLQQRLKRYKNLNAPKFSKGISPTVGGSDGILRSLMAHSTGESGGQVGGTTEQVPNAAMTMPQAAENVMTASSSPDRSHRVVPDPILEDNVFRVWLSEHPHATKDEIQKEMRRRNAEKLDHERAARVKTIREWQMELAELERQQELAKMLTAQEENELEMKRQLERQRAKEPHPPSLPPRRKAQLDAELAAQKSAWEVFQHSSKEVPSRPETPPIAGVEDIHSWVEEGWRFHSHRHEVAAVKIQSQFRILQAKRKLAEARVRRQRTLKAVLLSEESAKLAWEMAVASSEQELTQAAVDSRFKAIEFWRRQMTAKILRRRKAQLKKQAETDDLQNYAATRIQAVWRGGQQRQQIREMMDPTIAERRVRQEQYSAAVAIQRVFKGYSTRQRLESRRVATIKIQRAFRRFVASVCLAKLRRAHRRKEVDATRDYAARLIQRCLLAGLRRKYSKLALHADRFTLLQYVGRGYRARRSTMGQLLFHSKGKQVVLIQSVYRRHLAKKVVAQRRAALEQYFDAAKRETASFVVIRTMRRLVAYRRARRVLACRKAVRVIQRVWRGYLGRRRSRALREERALVSECNRRDDAAVMIQSLWRGYATRLRRRRDSSSSGSPQPHAPVVQDDLAEYIDLGHDAAKTIQTFYKAVIRWKKLRGYIHTAALVLTRFLRRVPAMLQVQQRRALIEERLAVQREDSAAGAIQRAFRGHQARRTVAHAREVRMHENRQLQRAEAVDVLHRFFRRTKAQQEVHRKRAQHQDQQQTEQHDEDDDYEM